MFVYKVLNNVHCMLFSFTFCKVLIAVYIKYTEYTCFCYQLLYCYSLPSSQTCKCIVYSGVAWHTPVRTCVRFKIKIRKREKAKKVEKCNKTLRQVGVSGEVTKMSILFKQYIWFSF